MNENQITRANVQGIGLERIGPVVRTTAGEFVDLSGGQHALLYSHAESLTTLDLNPRVSASASMGVSRSFVSAESVELSEWLADYSGDDIGLTSVFLSGGTEAIEYAISAAFAMQRASGNAHRTSVLGFDFSYHGFSLAARGLGRHPQHYRRMFSDGAASPWPILSRHLLDDADGLSLALDEVFAKDSVAALVIEPIGGTTSGAHIIGEASADVLLRKCRDAGVVIIADEVITGFGRTGPNFAWAQDRCDIRVSGKLLGGGIAPICAVSFTAAGRQYFGDGRYHPALGTTYSGNALASGLALSLQTARPPHHDMQVESYSALVKNIAKPLELEYGFKLRGRGYLLAAHFPAERPHQAMMMFSRNALACKTLTMGGVSHHGAGFHIMFTPALDSKPKDLERMLAALAACAERYSHESSQN